VEDIETTTMYHLYYLDNKNEIKSIKLTYNHLIFLKGKKIE
jgi:hypothetical protein